MLKTPFPDINKLLKSLLSQIQRIFQEKLVGVYLYGSLTTDDCDPQISDIDLLAVTSSDVTDMEFEALHVMHRDFAREYPVWEDRVEVAYISVAALRTFRSERSPMAVISPGQPFHMKDAGTDWLMNWYIPLSTWVHQVRDRKGEAYAILTMCRALYTHRTGRQASKRQAALWAQRELPEWARLIHSALAWREGWREEQVGHAAISPETVRFVNFVSDQILPRGS